MTTLGQRVPGAADNDNTLTVRGNITAAGVTLDHVQYLSERFVVTEIGDTTTLHAAELGGRFVVDVLGRRLRRVGISGDIRISHLREMIGEVAVHRDPEPVAMSGFVCRRYRVCNDSQRIVISAESFCARVEAIARTALHDERTFEVALHPLALPLDPDELVVSSTTRTYANGYQHVQCYRLASLTEGIEEIRRVEDFLRFPIEEGRRS
jgi:hypothetical protein